MIGAGRVFLEMATLWYHTAIVLLLPYLPRSPKRGWPVGCYSGVHNTVMKRIIQPNQLNLFRQHSAVPLFHQNLKSNFGILMIANNHSFTKVRTPSSPVVATPYFAGMSHDCIICGVNPKLDFIRITFSFNDMTL